MRHIQYCQIKDLKENMMQPHQGHLILRILLVNLDSNNSNIITIVIHLSNKDTDGVKIQAQNKNLIGIIKTFNNKFSLSYLECRIKQEKVDHIVIQMLNNMILWDQLSNNLFVNNKNTKEQLKRTTSEGLKSKWKDLMNKGKEEQKKSMRSSIK